MRVVFVFCLIPSFQGQGKPDACSVLVACGADRAAMRLDKFLDYRQPDTRAPCITGAGTIGPEKPFEQIRDIVLSNHRAAVGEDGLYAVRAPQG